MHLKKVRRSRGALNVRASALITDLLRRSGRQQRHGGRFVLAGHRDREGGAVSGVLATLVPTAAALPAVVAIVGCGQQASPAAGTSDGPPGARSLVAELAVLRRPPTAADRSLPAPASRYFHGKIVRSLTRLVATTSEGKEGDVRMYLVVLAVGPCGSRTANSAEAFLVTVTPHGGWGFGLGFTAGELGRFAVAPPPVPRGRDDTVSLVSSVVPDGVTRVRWIFSGRHGARATVYPRVHNNVAVSSVTPAESHSGRTTAIWQFAHGRVLTSKNETVRGCPAPEVVPGARNPIAPWLKQQFAIFRTSRLTRPMSIPRLDFEEAFAWRRLSLNFSQARFVKTGTGLPWRGGPSIKPGVWLVPGNRGVCLMAEPGQLGTCSPGSGYLSGHVPSEDASPESGGFRFSGGSVRWTYGRHMYSGLVPDGNRAVSIVLADGAVKTVPVVDNVYSLTVKGRAIVLIDKDAAGHRERFRLFANDYQFG